MDVQNVIRVDSSNAGRYNVAILLQRGVYVKRPANCTVNDFICNLLDVGPDALSAGVRTIMMDNKVVDDPDSETIQNGATLVLSGAMPGLVGAMLRSDSPYKAMRATITSAAGRTVDTPMLKVKLFNTVLKKHSNRMVEHGFWIENDG